MSLFIFKGNWELTEHRIVLSVCIYLPSGEKHTITPWDVPYHEGKRECILKE